MATTDRVTRSPSDTLDGATPADSDRSSSLTSSDHSCAHRDDDSKEEPADEPRDAGGDIAENEDAIRHVKTEQEAEGSQMKPALSKVASSVGPPHTVFTKGQRGFIIFMAAWASFFSPTSGQIYFPAVNSLATDMNVSVSLINLTITSYMIFQGLAPSFLGTFADAAGRRPAYIVSFIIYIAANIGLALQDNYAALFVLRCVQSSGCSSTVALAYGVVADVTTVQQRGVAMGFVSAGSLLGPSLGPVIGGLLSQYLGWPSIFWFLAIFAGAFVVPFVIFFPETSRKVVGNGSIPAQGWNMSLINWLQVRKRRQSPSEEDEDPSSLPPKQKMTIPNPLGTFKILVEKESCLVLTANSVIFAVFYQLTASVTSQFKIIYNMDDLHIGLCYLPFGVGCSLAALFIGRCIDYNYRRISKALGMPIRKGRQADLRNFPIEKARLQVAIPLTIGGAASTVAYGWVLDTNQRLVAPLILLFMCGFCITGTTSIFNNLIVDLHVEKPATATAANNLYRCLLGAGATALLIPMIDGMGRGWCFTFDALLLVALVPLMMWVSVKGIEWRRVKRERKERKAKEREEHSGAEEKV